MSKKALPPFLQFLASNGGGIQFGIRPGIREGDQPIGRGGCPDRSRYFLLELRNCPSNELARISWVWGLEQKPKHQKEYRADAYDQELQNPSASTFGRRGENLWRNFYRGRRKGDHRRRV